MEVSIIYVNWNSVDYLRESIASVYEFARGIDFEIIVVDNASPSGNVDILKQEFSEITIIKSDKNLGFAGANNLGAAHSCGKHLLFLNPDTKLLCNAISILSIQLESLPKAGIIGCKLLNGDMSVQTSCIQTFPTILNQVFDVDLLRNRWPNSRLWGTSALFSNSSQPAKVQVISGACLMIKRDVFAEVNQFSEDYFMYAEDLDLCYKVARAGYTNYYTGDAAVIHYGGTSSSPRAATIMKWRSILLFCRKSRGRVYSLMFRVAMTTAAVTRLFIVAGISLFGNAVENKETRHSIFAKWGVILRTLLTPSNAKG